MCATCSSVLVLPRSNSLKLVCVGGQPPRTASARAHAPCLQQLEQLAGRCGQELELLAGRCGQELEQLAGRCGAGVCACVCAACVRACGVCARVVFACVRRACVRLRACARGAAHDSPHFLRRAFGSGRVSDVEVREFVGVRKSTRKVQVVKVLKVPK